MKTFIWFFLLFIFNFSSFLSAHPLTDSRNLSLGGLVVSDPNVETCLFTNSAYLSRAENLKTSLSQAKTSADNLDFEVACSFPLVKDQIGMAIGWDAQVSQNQAQYTYVRDSNGQIQVDPTSGMPLTQVLGFFTQSNNVFYGSLGINTGFFSLGATLKYYLQDFGNLEGTGFGYDLGFNAELSKELAIGSTLYDLQNTVVNFQGNAPNTIIPASWTTSATWNFWKNDRFSFLVVPGVSSVLSGSSLQWAVGMEGSLDQTLFARVGVNQDRASFGIGLVAHPGKVFSEVKVDYAYLGGNTNDFPSRLTLTTTW